MTISEFSNEFDVLYNNVMSNQAPGLDEYEKSVFLTKAQDDIVKAYFDANSNKSREGFDDSPKRQIDFSMIIESEDLYTVPATTFDYRSLAFRLPSTLFLSLNEQLKVNNRLYAIIPISYTEYSRLMSKPYKLPPKNQAWRIITKNAAASSYKESVGATYTIDSEVYSLIIRSNYSKPVRFILKTVTGDVDISTVGNYPKVEETSSLVTITCSILAGTQLSKYRNVFLVNSASKHTAVPSIPNIEAYVGNFTGGEDESVFPNFMAPSSAVTIYDVTNPGVNTSGKSTIAEVIGKFDSGLPVFKIRYVRKPTPIILTDLTSENVSIEGLKSVSECELAPELHLEILQRAVELAKAAYTGDLQSQIALGQSSQTNMGIVAQQR